MTNLPDAHTHPAPAAPGTAPRFICGTSPADWEQVALLAERDKNVTPFFGIHPWRLNPAAWKEEMRLLESFLKKFPRAGIGETGLDKCRRGIPGLPLQREALKQHLELAARLQPPRRPALLPRVGHAGRNAEGISPAESRAARLDGCPEPRRAAPFRQLASLRGAS